MKRFLAAATLIGAGLAAGLVLSWRVELGPAVAERNLAWADSRGQVNPAASPESPFVSVADRVVPAVVAISTESRAPGKRQQFHPWGDMFEDLFPNDPRNERDTPQRPPRQQGSGSGFFLDEDGYIMTNNHVVNDAEKVTVTLSDGSELDAELVGQDPETDIALIKVDPKDHKKSKLPALELGDSNSIRVGDWAIAVGNPFGQLAGSMTVGVISAKGRQDLNIMGGTPQYQDFIQTDASINFGNSGGPLVNVHGQVIGVNTAINPAGQGLGFAIPINMARQIADQLKKSGRVVRGYLGIYPQALTPELAESLDAPREEGIIISQLESDTPAAQAGLHQGDVIIEMNGKALNSDVNAFRLQVAQMPVGETIHLKVFREGKTQSVDVKLGERPSAVVAGAPGKPVQDEESWAGLRVEEVERGVDRGVEPEEGVRVIDVEPDSPADDAGVHEGDIVKEIGNIEISSLRDYRNAVKKYADKKAVALLLKRDEQTLYVGLKP
ncbi:MAG TPA: Do family serine endopeptidase [Candidatus Eisenbacteria bacterium]|nr:Do family serine endopeptidase [Candidatus Eisenbacteria bacterium]